MDSALSPFGYDANGNLTGTPDGTGGTLAYVYELGIWYYTARFYSPTLGRFLQTDPVGYKDQVSLYGYVGNDPIDGRDPSGLEEDTNKKRKYSHPNVCKIEDDKIGKSTVGQAGNVLTNESRDLSGGKPGELYEAKLAEGHAIANNLSLERPHQTAENTLSPGAASSTGRAQDVQVMRQVYTDRAGGRPDPAGGRTYFGNSTHKINSRTIGGSRQTVFKRFGPFDHGSGKPQYIYIYNDPLPPPPAGK